MKKVILSIFMMLLPMLVSAGNSEFYDDNLNYSYDILHKILTVYGNGPMRDYSYTNSPWYGFREEIQTIIIKEGVTSIGQKAFSNFRSLTSVTIPNSLTSIGENAFYECYALPSITIPNSVTSIGRDAFLGTAWYNNLPDGLVYAGKVAYKYKGEMPENTHITIQEGTIEITDDAFQGCSGLANITIPNSVTSIGDKAFDGTTWYNNQPYGLVYAGNVAYKYKGEMPENTHIVIHEGTIEIADNAFNNCSGLTSISIPNGVTSIGIEAFSGCVSLTSATIPNSVINIGKKAFSNCSSLTSVIIPNSVKSIGSSVFEYCRSLTSIIIPNSVTSINPSAFFGCSSLTSVTFPNSVTSIGDYAFQNCSELSELTFPNKIKTIGSSSFSGCEGLETLNIPNSLTSIGEKAFFGCNGLKTLYIPANLTSIGSGAISGCNGLTSITVDNGNMVYDSRDNCNAIIETKTNTLLIGCNNSTIPYSIQVIGFCAFQNCKELKTIIIPNTVLMIQGYAFSGSGLESIEIPNSVKEISNAFSSCRKLTSINLPESISSISDRAFSNSGIQSIVIPQSVTKIYMWAFDNCMELKDVFCLGEDAPEITNAISYYNIEKNATLHVPESSIEKYKSAKNWSYFGNIVALTNEELAMYGVNISSRTLSNSIEGIYMTQPDNYCVNKGTSQSYGKSYEIMIFDNGDGTYYVDDLFGGWYSQRISYGPNYAMTGDIEISTNGVVSLKGSYVTGWGDSLMGLTGTYDSEKHTFVIEEEYLEGLKFFQTWVKVGDVFTVDGIIYSIDDNNTVSVRKGKEPYSGEIKIPNNVSHNDFTYQVTSIDGVFSGNTSLNSVSLPNSVKSISGAFRGCTGLKSVNIPNTVTSIEKYDFDNCTNLTSINIPNSVTSIGEWAFPSCTNLTTLTIPSSVVSIGDDAFMDCINLSDLTLSDGLITIGNGVFSGCNGLKSLIIPKSVLRIGDSVFYMCENLESIHVDNENVKYDSRDNCNAIIETYTNKLILGCKNTVIPQDVTTIGLNAFIGCVDLKSFDIPNSVTSIEQGAFWKCTGLESFRIGNNVKDIGRSAFSECEALKSVIFPNNVSNIQSEAFYHCNNLQDVYCYAETIPTTNVEAFNETPIVSATLHVPAASIDKYRQTAPWSGFGKIVALTPEEMGIDGDVNGDNVLDEKDLNAIVNHIMGKPQEGYFDINLADVNKDGKVDAADIVELVNMIRNK